MRYVIGSGPSGVMCAEALLEAGLEVTMLDVGTELPAEAARVAADLARKDIERWSAEDVEDARGPVVLMPSGIPKRLAFGSDFAYAKDADLGLTQEGCHCSVSHAKGGFSAIWGGSVLPNRAEDFADWPVTLPEMAPHYKAVAEIMGIAASEDDPLLDWFPHYAPVLPAAPRSEQAQYVFGKSRRHAAALERRGIRVGASRLALRTRPDAAGRLCRNAGLCLTGCPFSAVYSSAHTLEALMKRPKFRYVGGHRAERLEERPDGVAIVARRLSDGAEVRFEAERVYVGCGALGTAMLVAASAPQASLTLPMTYQPYFLIPLLLAGNFPDVARERTHALNQLNVEIEDARVSPRAVHLQFSTFNHIIQAKLEGILRFFPLVRGLLRRLLLGRIVTLQGYAHGEEAAPIQVTFTKTSRGVETSLRGEPAQARQAAVASACARTLARNAAALGMMPIPFMTILGTPGIGSHSGALFPMRAEPGPLETDRLGRLPGHPRVHLIDGSVLTTIPAATITYTIMANAHRIGAESATLDAPAAAVRAGGTVGAVAVTGAGGYVGSALAAAFERSGRRVVRLSRPAFRLGERLDPAALRGIDVLVHAAWDFSLTRPSDIRRVNVEGARKLFDAAVAAGVKKIIVVSSAAAFEGCVSDYGRAKRAVEAMAAGVGAAVVRPGIVYGGAGGIMPKLAMLARLPATPLFDSGTQPVLTTHLDDLAALVLALASDARPAPRGPITAAYPETIPFEEVLARLARTQGRAPRFVRIPSFLPLLALKALETLGLRPPIRSDALVGLLATDPKPDFSRTAMSGVAWRRFDG